MGHRTMGSGRWSLWAAATLVALLGILLAAPRTTQAIPSYIHGAAQSCDACHHAEPPSFQTCSTCHDGTTVPNQACTKCHSGKTTTGATCWSCHAPGQSMPAPTDEACRGCHGAQPHLGASDTCTSCHSTSPTPHHDDIAQKAPSCTDCHQHAGMQSHDGQACTACHSSTIHPNIPAVPGACNACHSAGTFNGVGACTDCHAGTAPFNGQTDNDIHDSTIPDAPISAHSCTSCHPGKQKHGGGAVACLDCHADATAFHHGTASSPGFKDCVSCHGQKPQHGSGLPCTTCHPGAQHQSDPPRPQATVCYNCHAASTFGSPRCYDCHKPPVYHAPHAVGTCSSCHGTSRAAHAGRVTCTRCHSNINRGHHLTRVQARACQSAGCHVQERHVGVVACTSCHGRRAMHDRTPLNLPAVRWMVCDRCHPFTDKALAAGVPACTQCHDTTFHSATYRVRPCAECHAGKDLHAGKVECRSCHYDPGPGHHRVGPVGARACADCHVETEIHASSTTAGADFSCGTCHEGSVHGIVGLPDPKRCLDCHPQAAGHTGDLRCTECHWPAVHAGKPDVREFGGFTKMPVVVPTETPGVVKATTTTTAPAQTTTTTTAAGEQPPDTFARSGADLGLFAAIAASLGAAGLAIRRRLAGGESERHEGDD